MNQKKSQRNPPPLAREEWDFGRCPADLLELCFGYEYARESPWAINKFKRHGHAKEDEWGVWHLEAALGGHNEMDDDELLQFLEEVGLTEDYDFDCPPAVNLWLPPGFPEKPFLANHFEFGTWMEQCEAYWRDELEGYDDSWALTQVPPAQAAQDGESVYAFQIQWDAADGLLLNEFRAWLRQHRPTPPVETRGKSREREYAADLKALGAYRLLKRFSAPQAQDFTEQFVRGGLYAKLPDWYQARKRAERTLRAFFRVEPVKSPKT